MKFDEYPAGAPRQPSGPLTGVKVLDLTSVLMGPYCTQIFADLGADVIKVESAAGDTTRFLPPGHHPDRGGMFLNMNRGKRSIVLDLKHPEGRAVLLRLVEQADVLLHSMRPQAIARLKLTYPDLAPLNPRLVYANLYGFSRAGPYADYPAYDDVIQAASGLTMLQAELNDGTPSYLATVVADKVTGLTGAYSIMAALLHRERSGEGQEIEIPMFETMVSFVMIEHLCGSLFDTPMGPPMYPRVISPERRPYRTKDGHIAVMIYNDRHWRGFFEALGHPDWSKDPMFSSVRTRTHNIKQVLAKVAEVMSERTTQEWIELLRSAEVPAMPLFTTQDLLNDPHLQQTGFWQTLDTKEGRLRFPGIPTRFSRTPGRITDAGPALGEHSAEVLAQHGFSAEEIDRLMSHDIVRGMSAPAGV